MKATTLACAALVLASCVSPEPREPSSLVGIATVLGNPAAYDGQLVRVRGAAVVRFEASFICPIPDLVDSDSSKTCLWLVPGAVGRKAYDIRPFHGKMVEVVGRFNAKHFGHMGAYGGSIAPIWGKVTGTHGMSDIPPPPPPPPESSANNSFKPKPLRGSA